MAQLLCVVGLPRLRETHSLLSSMQLSSNALTHVEESLSKVINSTRQWTFFGNGAMPVELQCSESVSDNMATCKRLTSSRSVQAEGHPFPTLFHHLPKSFQCLADALNEGSSHLTSERTKAQLTYRLFELHTISDVLEEVMHCLDN